MDVHVHPGPCEPAWPVDELFRYSGLRVFGWCHIPKLGGLDGPHLKLRVPVPCTVYPETTV